MMKSVSRSAACAWLSALALLATAPSGPASAQEADAALYSLLRRNGDDADRLYTTHPQEGDGGGYTQEGIVGKCFSQPVSGSSPLYRLYSPSASDHLYTTNDAEKDTSTKYNGYKLEGITCHVYTEQKPGTCPLFRLFGWSPRSSHIYTLDKSEVDRAVAGTSDPGQTYFLEGVAAFLAPHGTETCPR